MSPDNSTTYGPYRIEPLQGSENYRSWKIMMLDILTDTGLDDHVDPDLSGPAADADAKEKAKWKKDDRRALTIIRLRVSPNVIHSIEGETTARSAWDMLSHLFELKGHMGLILARRKFYGTRAPNEAPLQDHIQQMRQFQGELRALGQKVEDADFAVALLGSLPDSYDSFVQAILSVTAVPDSKTIISSILTEQTRRDKRADESVALTASSRTATRYPKQRYHAPPAPAPTSSAPMASWKNAICHKCNGKGHIARVCPSQPIDEQHNDETHAHPAYDDDSDYESDDYAF
jgi:hypothetical protein